MKKGVKRRLQEGPAPNGTVQPGLFGAEVHTSAGAPAAGRGRARRAGRDGRGEGREHRAVAGAVGGDGGDARAGAARLPEGTVDAPLAAGARVEHGSGVQSVAPSGRSDHADAGRPNRKAPFVYVKQPDELADSLAARGSIKHVEHVVERELYGAGIPKGPHDYLVIPDEGAFAIAILIAVDIDSETMMGLRAAIADAVSVTVAWRCVRSVDLARDEAVFRLGGLSALEPLLEWDVGIER